MSTEPVQHYVSYLTTDELAASYNRVLNKLFTPEHPLSPQQRRVLRLVGEDLRRELQARQTRFC